MNADQFNALLSSVAKPSQYLGNEVNVVRKDFDSAQVRVCLVFPDKYEMGMSHIGLKILYEVLNQLPEVVCERAFAPELDMEAALRKQGLRLFSLESKRPLSDFDIIGFSLTYELTYTNMLAILDLGGIPVWQKDRKEGDPLIIAGGGCTMNAEPVADFLDAAVVGDGEEVILEIVEKVREWRMKNPNEWVAEAGDPQSAPAGPRSGPMPTLGVAEDRPHSRRDILSTLAVIEGVYVPSLFEPEYHDDKTLRRMRPLKAGYERINKRIVENIDKAPYPTKILVPSVKLIHDRIGIEIQRGCNRHCRFCQAGYIDRPVRQRSPETILKIAEESMEQTGIDEISLLSLSAADYACLVDVLKELNARYADQKVAISVPATRTEKLTPDLIDQIKKVRKTGFTIAPEAGSARMRRVINKGNEIDDLLRAVTNAFSRGWDLLKLYYMVGLPFEREEDVRGIADEANTCIKICKQHSARAELKLGVSSFVPKPHTPFQWEPQMTLEETKAKYGLIRRSVADRRIRVTHHVPEMSFIEGLMSRGDRRMAKLIHIAFESGCRFDEWEEHFDFSKWQAAILKWGIDPAFYLHRRRHKEEVLPWDHLFAQMDKNWLWEELEKAAETAASEDCSIGKCNDCGVCDFRKVKNRVYVPGENEIMAKKGHREWYGWTRRGEAGPRPDLDGDPPDLPCKSQFSSKIRARFSKTANARFMGHLELMGVLKRAFKRIKLPVAFSEGFHPQMKLAMGYPLGVGIESEWEYFDIELAQKPVVIARRPEADEAIYLSAREEIASLSLAMTQNQIFLSNFKSSMNQVLPEGLSILEVEFIDRATPSLYSSTSELVFSADLSSTLLLSTLVIDEAMDKFRNASEFVWFRQRSGKNERAKQLNLKKLVHVTRNAETLSFTTKVSPDGSIKPQEVMKALFGFNEENISQLRLKKTGILWRDEKHPSKDLI